MPVWSTFWFAARAAGASGAVSVTAGLWLAWRLESGPPGSRRTLAVALRLAQALPAPALICSLLWAACRSWPPALLPLILAGVVSGLPAFAAAAGGALAGQDPLYANAAQTLGASSARVFLLARALACWRRLALEAALATLRVFAEIVVAFWLVGALG